MDSLDSLVSLVSLEIYLPWLALLVSAISLAVSVHSIYRDRSKIRVLSKVYYDRSLDLDNPPPFLAIYVVNTGKRPLFISNIVGYANWNQSNLWSLKDDSISFDENGFPSVFKSGLVHEAGLRLNDGDIYEYRVRHDEHEKLYSSDSFMPFKKYYLTDVLGKKYPVKGSKKGIRELLKYQA
ncbi:hypothetical protein [Vibrio cholerae]|uniref:hypothetical protein n=1 Tax=Vibrio cholerae TaxID=666 RepID=UPI002271E517|nr:hypothetical protein [Vibrio cholerae]